MHGLIFILSILVVQMCNSPVHTMAAQFYLLSVLHGENFIQTTIWVIANCKYLYGGTQYGYKIYINIQIYMLKGRRFAPNMFELLMKQLYD